MDDKQLVRDDLQMKHKEIEKCFCMTNNEIKKCIELTIAGSQLDQFLQMTNNKMTQNQIQQQFYLTNNKKEKIYRFTSFYQWDREVFIDDNEVEKCLYSR